MANLKNSVFTFITVVVVPLLFFVLLELGLVVFGVGKSFDYFYEIDIAGEAHYQENPDFADQFYPESLNIGPLENTFSKDRAPDLIRVYILGGSAAQGFPHKNHGFDRLLDAQLRAAFPAKKIEVINTAMTSVNSHVVYAVANSIPDESADYAIILMGNNEVVGPYGPGTFNQNFLANISMIRATQSLKRTRLWQALAGLLQNAGSDNALQELEWEGMQMFTNNGVSRDDPRMASVYSHYENNLTDIIEILQSKGIDVLLSSVPVNLRHSAPFLSVHDAALSDEQLAEWQTLFHSGVQSAESEDWSAAVGAFESAIEQDPGHADAHFRLATSYERIGEHANAKKHYQHALDLDALRFRADSELNRIIAEVASSYDDDLTFIDSAAAFERASAPYQPGWNLLLEHVHYDFYGNHVLAAEFAATIAGDDFEPLAPAEVANRVGFPNYDTIEEIKNLQGMIEHPPFPGQNNYQAFERFLESKLANVTSGAGSQADIVQRRQSVVNDGNADWKLHFELAVLNQRLRNPPAMYFHLNKILELYPHNHETYMKLADALSREGRWREVIPHLERSLYYTRGDGKKIAEAVNWIGTAYLRIGDYDNAKKRLLEIPENHPDEIDLSLKAYANLIRYSRENRKTNDLESYVDDVQSYANRLVRQGKDQDYPLLYDRMVRIMTMGGKSAESKAWADAKPQ